ncbi:MAG: PqiC family protein [Opitutaceae bacterium]
MKNRVFNRLSVLVAGVLALFLSACVNLKPKADAAKLYALGSAEPVLPANVGAPAIYISKPDLPAYLDGKRLQYRKASGEVADIGRARWAEPLEEGIARSLAEYLMEVSNKPVQAYFPWPDRTKGSLDLYVRMYKLGAFENGDIQMTAAWELKDGAKIQRSGTFQSTDIAWTVDDAESFVAGLNAALAQLASELAKTL